MWLNILYFVLIYISIVFFWFVVSTLAYFFALIFKKTAVVSFVTGVGLIIQYIANLVLGLLLIWQGITYLIHGEILQLVVYILIGAGLISWLYGFLQLPFTLITTYYIDRIERLDFNEDIATAELLDEKGKVIKKIEGDTSISIRMAKYFIALYLLNLLTMFISQSKPETGYKWADYITLPFVWIISSSLILGIPYLLIHKIRHKQWFTDDKRLFFTTLWKFNFYIYAVIGALIYIILPIFL